MRPKQEGVSQMERDGDGVTTVAAAAGDAILLYNELVVVQVKEC